MLPGDELFWQKDEAKKLLTEFLNIKPSYTKESYKGENGRICVIGGSKLYHGAPCLAADAALISGAELVYIITSPEAAPAIKTHSPDFIVSPSLAEKINNKVKKEDSYVKFGLPNEIFTILQKVHSVLIGPGMGDSIKIKQLIASIISYCVKLPIPIVIDADCLRLMYNLELFNIIKNNIWCLLTPNKREKDILYFELNNLNKDINATSQQTNDNNIEHFNEKYISNKFHGPSFLFKGYNDNFCYLNSSIESSQSIITKRPGGIGDILSGVCTIYMAWAYKSYTCKSQKSVLKIPNQTFLSMEYSYIYLSTIMASMLVKGATYKCYLQKQQAMRATDVLKTLTHFIQEKLTGL